MLSFALFALLGLFFAFRPTLLSGFAWMQADPGDSRLSQYILEHSYLWLRGDALHRAFWNAPFFFPEANVSAYTDLHLGTAPIYWALRWLGFLPDTSTQLWLIAVALLNFAVAYLFLRRAFSFSSFPSSLGAFLFAFSSPRLCQIGHFQLYEQFWTVLAVWAVLEVFRSSGTAQIRWIWLFFISLVLQIYSAFYLGWFLCFALYLACWVALCSKQARRNLLGLLRRHRLTLAFAAALSAIALWPMAFHSLEAAHRVGMKHFDEVEYYAPRLPSWFYLGTRSWLYSWLNVIPYYRLLPAKAEHQLGIGLITSYVAVRTLYARRRLPVWSYLWAVSLLLVLLSTRIQPFYSWPWHLAAYLGFPGGGAIRAPGRLVLLLLIPAMIAVAAFFEDRRGQGRTWRVGALLVVILLEQGQWLSYFDKGQAREAVASVARAIPRACKSFYLVSEEQPASAQLDLVYEIDAMLASISRGVPTVNGYSGSVPPGWSLQSLGEPGDPKQALRSWLSRYPVDTASSCLVGASVAAIPTHVEKGLQL